MKALLISVAVVLAFPTPGWADQQRSYSDGATAATYDACGVGDLCAIVRLPGGSTVQFYNSGDGIEVVTREAGGLAFTSDVRASNGDDVVLRADHNRMILEFRVRSSERGHGIIDPSIETQ
jgi:hypothetical protein